MPVQPAIGSDRRIRRDWAITKDPAINGGASVGSRLLLALIVLSCLVQLIGLYRPGSPPTTPAIPYMDKLGHLMIFALPVAVILLYRASRAAGAISAAFGAVVIVIFAVHGVISELIQGWLLPQRDGDPYDVLADLAGVALGYGAAMLIVRRRAGAIAPPPGSPGDVDRRQGATGD